MQFVVQRQILDWPRNSQGLFIQPTEIQYRDPKLQTIEQHNRDRAAAKGDYADMVTGNPHTIDPLGRYNCGRCNQVDGFLCLLMKMKLLPRGKIDREAGSCGKWEIICAGDAEVRLHNMSPITLGYAEAANGRRFGCEVCPLKVRALVPDSLGRTYWCGYWFMRVFPNACCNANATKQRKINFPKEAYAA